MRECSAWCRPEDRIHVHTESYTHPDIEVARLCSVGLTYKVSEENKYCCYPSGTWVVCLAVDPVVESFDPTPHPEYTGFFLWTIQEVYA